MKYKIEPCANRGFFSHWVQFGKKVGYLKLDECIVEINKHKIAMLELDKLNKRTKDV